ncbi:cache domain-containing protein [Desulfovibrio ferrophilus]|uniref:histidine kinase n=1 Tax=Desulfovibrio ferrophilus TaxID=241368 RepID=A0A2Z6AUB9_9BACT|nr:cache domain-containing protein [Desulfovibrio ferrophilus]BBD06819.1 PAS/PAC sensor signal transduction histidine kinase [Desulfovibrio ferrophilus]
MNIRTKIFAGFFLIFAGTILAGGLVLYIMVKDTLQRNIENELSNSSATLLELVRNSVDVSVRNRLRAVAEKNQEIISSYYERAKRGAMTEASAKQLAVEMMNAQRIGLTGYIYCLDSDGVVVVHPVTENLGRDVSEFDFVQQQKALKEGYLEYYWKNPGEDELRPKALYMAYFEPWDWIISVSTYREEFRELVDIRDFRRSILAQRFGHEGYAFVLDSLGNLVAHPFLSGNMLNARGVRGRELTQEMISRKFGKIKYWWKNPGDTESREKIVIYNYLPEVDWIVAASGYIDDFNAPLTYLRRMAVLVVLVVLCLGLPFSWWVGMSVTSSLKELGAGFAKASEGEFTVRLAERSKDEMGRVAKYFNNFMDRLEAYDNNLRREIRDRRVAEAGEKQVRNHLQDIIDSMPIIVLGVDADNRITLWNRRAEDEMGIPRVQALGKDVATSCPASGTFLDLLDEVQREHRSVSRDKVMGLHNGQAVYRSIDIYPLAGAEGVVIVIADVTDRVQMEEMMIQTEKMMSVGGLAAGMAHEINNPLGGILQGAQNIIRRLSPRIKANAKVAEEIGCSLDHIERYMQQRGILHMLDGIRESGMRAAQIVANMLEFSRASESKRALSDLSSLLEKALELAGSEYDLKRQYDFKKILVERDFDLDLPPVMCSATEIEQVFLNLFRNAAQAMFLHGAAGVPMLRLKTQRDGDWVRVEIADNGPGMDEETRRRIFEPFFTTKEVGQGTGLGLSVSYFIITDNHGGTFAVESSPGRGATFTIRLPI